MADVESQRNPKLSGSAKGSSPLEIFLFVVADVLLLIMTVLLLGSLFWAYSNSNVKENICGSLYCLKMAAVMANKMNESVDPCEDFNEYACGRYNSLEYFQSGVDPMGTIEGIDDRNAVVMKAILTEAVTPEQPVYLQNMKRFYKSCVNEDPDSSNRGDSYLSNTAFVTDWPTLNLAWDASSFNLNDALARYAAVDVFPFLQLAVLVDIKNSRKRALYLGQANLVLTSENWLNQATDPLITLYYNYMLQTALALGANETVAEHDMRQLMTLMKALSTIQVSVEDLEKAYNIMTFKQLSKLYPKIDLPRIVRATFATANITLNDDQVVINLAPDYFKNLSQVISAFPSRTVQNFIGFTYAKLQLLGAINLFDTINLKSTKVHLRSRTEIPRWQLCVTEVSTTFSTGMAKQFVKRMFTVQAKAYVDDMVTNLKSAFREILLENTWMGQATKQKAVEKLDAMRRKVGYPDVDFSEDDINRKFENYVMNETAYRSNVALKDKLAVLERKRFLGNPIDRSRFTRKDTAPRKRWITLPQVANAAYSVTGNELLMHAAILQSPVFSETLYYSMNYGAIGAVIGHEVTHGFDNTGSQFDKDGNFANWWQASDKMLFLEKVKCLVDQYSGFYIKEMNMSVNGSLTLGENIADNGGLKESYRAYKRLVEKKGESPILPGLGLTQDQLFFLSFGQLWCQKIAAEDVNLKDEHSPNKYRINGVMQNSEDFSRAFNCPRASYMNPEKKCSVW